ncbi:MAG: ABC transporter permease [Thermoprotei archaeon]
MANNILLFTVRRVVNAVITLIFLIFLIFALIHVIAPTPEDLARIYAPSPRVTPSELQAVIRQYHLDAPLPTQFVNYIVGIFHGNWGLDTLYHEPVLQVIGRYMPVTLEMVIIGDIVAVLIGLFTGTVAAANRKNPADYTVKGLYLATWSAPVFLVGVSVQLLFAYTLNLLPSTGLVNPTLTAPPPVTGYPYLSALPQPLQGSLSSLVRALTSAPLIDSLLTGHYTYFVSLVHHMVLPALTIGVISFGSITRLTRASMVDALDKDYVKLAYMKGLGKRQVVYGTAFRNGIIPIITLIALIFGFSTGGAVIVEDIYNYHGIGYFTVQALYNLDYPSILGITLIIGMTVIAANFVADLLYGIADPRVRVG